MRRRADAGRSVVESARVLLAVIHQFADRGRGQRGGHDEHVRHVGDLHDGHEIDERIDVELAIERRIDGDRPDRIDDQRVAVGRRARCELGADIPAAAGAIVDDERLLQALRQLLADHARQDVGGAASGEGDDDTHRSVGIVGCVREPVAGDGRCGKGNNGNDGADKRASGPRPARAQDLDRSRTRRFARRRTAHDL